MPTMPTPDRLCAGDHGAAVTTLQQRLRSTGLMLEATGLYDDATVLAVRAFQIDRGLVVDGIAGPRTHAALFGRADPKVLTEADVLAAAETLGVPPASVHAVMEVEAPHGGFLPDGRVVILFERHVFWERLQAVGVDPTLCGGPSSILSPKRGGYVGGAGEYPRLAQAKAIAAEPAMESCSWGRFQIMGYNARRAGYDSASAMAQAFAGAEGEQLRGFVRYVQQDATLLAALKARKWAAFARQYNGPAYADNLYDTRLARAYARYVQADKEVA